MAGKRWKKVLQDEELSMHSISRESAVALRNIKSGELIRKMALTVCGMDGISGSASKLIKQQGTILCGV